MTDNRIAARYKANIVMDKPTVAKVLDGADKVDAQIAKNHERAVAAQISTQIRVETTHEFIGKLAITATRLYKDVHIEVVKETEQLDRGEKRDFAVVDFGEQVLATVSGVFLDGIKSAGEYLIAQAGDDIRDGIKDEPPVVAEKPTTIIYQQPAAPKMREARLFEGGRKKYVLDE